MQPAGLRGREFGAAQRQRATFEIPGIAVPRECNVPAHAAIGFSAACYALPARYECDIARQARGLGRRLQERFRELDHEAGKVAVDAHLERRGLRVPAAREQQFDPVIRLTPDQARNG